MSDNDKAESEKQVHVVDRRRFDTSGKERGDEGDSAKPQAREATSDHQADFKIQAGEIEAEDVSFTSFVMSLATQTMVQMGEMPSPQGMEIPVDVEAARQTIDILAMLQRKTLGNLSNEEGRFMEEVLHTLRMSYVRRKKK